MDKETVIEVIKEKYKMVNNLYKKADEENSHLATSYAAQLLLVEDLMRELEIEEE